MSELNISCTIDLVIICEDLIKKFVKVGFHGAMPLGRKTIMKVLEEVDEDNLENAVKSNFHKYAFFRAMQLKRYKNLDENLTITEAQLKMNRLFYNPTFQNEWTIAKNKRKKERKDILSSSKQMTINVKNITAMANDPQSSDGKFIMQFMYYKFHHKVEIIIEDNMHFEKDFYRHGVLPQDSYRHAQLLVYMKKLNA
uniref:Uncharacterized protein n=1 Tax=Romanomermis culicivorax TaxID=13658 RepID=A0A915JAK0_ROMCU